MNSSIFSKFKTIPFPCSVKILPDELLSSWMVRLAHNHLQKIHTFYDSLFPSIEIWNRDIDRLAPMALTETLSGKSLIPHNRVRESTLHSYDTYLYETCRTKTNTSWIIPLTISHRFRKSFGQMYCPSCLKKDKTHPYFRKKWRLSLSVVCPECKCFLLDKCPHCSMPINFHRIELGKKNELPFYPLSCCYNCLGNLASTKKKSAPAPIIMMQQQLYQVLDAGIVPSLNIQYSFLYFDVLRKIVSFLSSKSAKCVQFNKEICKSIGLKFIKPRGGPAHNFDTLPVSKRSAILYKAFWVLDKWPDRFLMITHKSNSWSSLLLRDFKNDCPYWYYNIVKQNNYIVYSEWTSLPDMLKYGSYSKAGYAFMRRKGINQ